MKIKNILMAAALATTILHAQAIVRDMESGNTVGFSYHEIRPGTNSIALPPFVEGGAEIGGKKTLALFLPAACEGDEVFVGSLKAIARKAQGTQHWFDEGKCVDDAPLPRKGETILYVRHCGQKSNISISGEVRIDVRAHEKPVHVSPITDKIKPVERPELYFADYLSYSTVRIVNLNTCDPRVTSCGNGDVLRPANTRGSTLIMCQIALTKGTPANPRARPCRRECFARNPPRISPRSEKLLPSCLEIRLPKALTLNQNTSPTPINKGV